jgi:hypothetical protein
MMGELQDYQIDDSEFEVDEESDDDVCDECGLELSEGYCSVCGGFYY